jgi:hypothetical protein
MNSLFKAFLGRSPKGTEGQPHPSNGVAVPVACPTPISPEEITRIMSLPRATRLQEFERLDAAFRSQVATARKELAASLRTLDTAEAEFKKLRRIVRNQP